MSSNRRKRDSKRAEKNIKDSLLRFCIITMLVSAGLFFLGIFVIANNKDVIFWVVKALGTILIVDAVIRFTKFFLKDREERQINLDIFRATLGGLVGIISVLWPASTLWILYIFIGIIILVEGAMQLQLAFNRRHDLDTWIPNFFIGLASAVFGLLIIINPTYKDSLGEAVAILFGIVIIVTAIMNLFASYNLLQMRKRLTVNVVDVEIDDIE